MLVYKKLQITRFLVIFLLVSSVMLTVSIFLVIPLNIPLNFAHLSILISFFLYCITMPNDFSISKANFYLFMITILLIVLSCFKFFFIRNETVIYINESFKTHSVYKYEPYPTFNSYFLFFKELLHLIFSSFIILTSSLIIKNSKISIEDFKRKAQKYLFYFLIFYISLYFVFLIYDDIIKLISTNSYNGFRSFQVIKNQYFTNFFKARLGVTLSEPSFSGLYVLIFVPFAFCQTKYRRPLLFFLLPLFFLMNSSKYAVGVGLIMLIVYMLLWLIKLLKNRKYFFLFPVAFCVLGLGTIWFALSNLERFSKVLEGQSGVSRLFSIFRGVEFFIDNFWSGIGIGQFPVYFTNFYGGSPILKDVLIRSPSAQSMFINGLSEFGFFYLIFIIFVAVLLIKAFKVDKIIFFAVFILIFNLNSSAGNGFNIVYYWVLMSFFTYYAWKN